jgi:hypothetical protein
MNAASGQAKIDSGHGVQGRGVKVGQATVAGLQAHGQLGAAQNDALCPLLAQLLHLRDQVLA